MTLGHWCRDGPCDRASFVQEVTQLLCTCALDLCSDPVAAVRHAAALQCAELLVYLRKLAADSKPSQQQAHTEAAEAHENERKQEDITSSSEAPSLTEGTSKQAKQDTESESRKEQCAQTDAVAADNSPAAKLDAPSEAQEKAVPESSSGSSCEANRRTENHANSAAVSNSREVDKLAVRVVKAATSSSKVQRDSAAGSLCWFLEQLKLRLAASGSFRSRHAFVLVCTHVHGMPALLHDSDAFKY